MDKVKFQPILSHLADTRFASPAIRTFIFVLVILLTAFTARTVWAQDGTEPTQISIGVPAQAKTGDTVTVQAVLVDSLGKPISKATVTFTTRVSFLNTHGDMVLAQAVTNKDGQAVAQFTDDFPGAITLQASFEGDGTYAASNAKAQINAAGTQQLYAEHIGVNIPGFNVPPALPAVAAVGTGQSIPATIARLWPAMNSWPIALVLIIVWSLYFRAVTLIYRIAVPKTKPADSGSAAQRRAL